MIKSYFACFAESMGSAHETEVTPTFALPGIKFRSGTRHKECLCGSASENGYGLNAWPATSFQTSSKKATSYPIPPAPHSALPFRLMRWGGGSQGCILLYKWTNNISSCFTPEKKYIKVIPLYTKKENHENHCCCCKN